VHGRNPEGAEMDQYTGDGRDPTQHPDDDPVLRRLAEDLARDDPRLAALLDGSPQESHPRHGRTRLLLVVTVPVLLTLGLLVPPTVAVGVIAMLLAIASPLVVCWMCATDRTAPGAQ
jgi:Flp pilus assembly protein TadB